MADKKVPANLQAEEPSYETFHMPNASNQRNRLAREAASLSASELKERAAEVGIPVSGSKQEMVGQVQDAVRGTEST